MYIKKTPRTFGWSQSFSVNRKGGDFIDQPVNSGKLHTGNCWGS